MPVSIEYKESLIHMRLYGCIDTAAMTEALAELTAMEEQGPFIPSRVTDTTGITHYELGFDEMLALATTRRSTIFPNCFKSAIIVGNEEQTGFARMFQTLNTNPQIEIQIFDDARKALEWVSSAP